VQHHQRYSSQVSGRQEVHLSHAGVPAALTLLALWGVPLRWTWTSLMLGRKRCYEGRISPDRPLLVGLLLLLLLVVVAVAVVVRLPLRPNACIATTTATTTTTHRHH
jgi:hypothetical protein